MAKRYAKPPATAEDVLRDHTPVVRALVDELRRVIRSAVPDAVEKPNRGWHSLNFHNPAAGYFCGLFPTRDGVSLAFEFGALLADPAGLLTGDGFQVRYMRVKRKSDIRVRALKRLLQAAVALPASRDVKLALIRAQARPVPTGR